MALEEANALEPLAVVPCIFKREATTLVFKYFCTLTPFCFLPPFVHLFIALVTFSSGHVDRGSACCRA